MTPEERAPAAQAEASAPQPDHIGHGEPLELGISAELLPTSWPDAAAAGRSDRWTAQ